MMEKIFLHWMANIGEILGYLPQEFGFYPEFSVHDYLMYIASIKGMRISIARKRVTELLRQVGLAKMQNRKMKNCLEE